MMMLLNLWKYRVLIGAGLLSLLVAAMYARISYLDEQLTHTEAARMAAVEVAKKNAKAAEALSKERDEVVAVLNSARAADTEREEKIRDILKEVHNAAASTSPASDRLDAAHRGVRSLVNGD
jgi:hypothetical protein